VASESWGEEGLLSEKDRRPDVQVVLKCGGTNKRKLKLSKGVGEVDHFRVEIGLSHITQGARN